MNRTLSDDAMMSVEADDEMQLIGVELRSAGM